MFYKVIRCIYICMYFWFMKEAFPISWPVGYKRTLWHNENVEKDWETAEDAIKKTSGIKRKKLS